VSVYSNTQIKQAINYGHIVFHPYNEKHIAGSSVDVTLGHYYFRTERAKDHPVYNPFDEADVDRYFGKAQKAVPHKQWCDEMGMKPLKGIPLSHPVIPVGPGERILAHTHEFIGIKAPGTSTMQARSTWGRNGVAVCLDAGWGDPGYINRWTMEVYNMNMHETVLLPVGERIAQMVFYDTGQVDSEYKKLSGKYQTDDSVDLDKLIRNWRPEQMLPRAFKDVRTMPTKIKGLKGD
jgi:dCTP deaminase